MDHVIQRDILEKEDIAMELTRISNGKFDPNLITNLNPVWSSKNDGPPPPGMLLHGSGTARAAFQEQMLREILDDISLKDEEKLAEFAGMISFFRAASSPSGIAEWGGARGWIAEKDPDRTEDMVPLKEMYSNWKVDEIRGLSAFKNGKKQYYTDKENGAPTIFDQKIIKDTITFYKADGTIVTILDVKEARIHYGVDDILGPDGKIKPGFEVGFDGSFFFGSVAAGLVTGAIAEAVDAKGSAALDLGALSLVGYGLYHSGIISELTPQALLDVIQRSNIADSIKEIDLLDVAVDIGTDLALDVAATALGVGLLWNGVQFIQSAANFDNALAFAAKHAPDDSIVKTMADLVEGVKELFDLDDTVEARSVAELLEQTDPDLALHVRFELVEAIATVSGGLSDTAIIQLRDLEDALTWIEQMDPALFNGGETLEEKIQYVLAEHQLKLGNVEKFIELSRGSCFGAEVMIDMWPLDEAFTPNPTQTYDQEALRNKIWQKPISQIKADDWVVSFDRNQRLVPGRVSRIFRNHAKILLNYFGTRVTPGHVYYRADGTETRKFQTLIDILRDDGTIQDRNGTIIRAATNEPMGGPLDRFVVAVTGPRNTEGRVDVGEQGRIRRGTRFIVNDGKEHKSYCVGDLIRAGGGIIGEDGWIRVADGVPMPFHWEFGDRLPRLEDYVLACSGTTLDEIYDADEWEDQRPHLPAPSAWH